MAADAVGGIPVTQLLARAREGDQRALDDAYAAIYQELKQVAHRQLRREHGPLETTALVHEAYLKLAGDRALAVNDRRHLLALSARAMRQVLVDDARARKADKRGGDEAPVPLTLLHEQLPSGQADAIDVLVVDELLECLQKIDPRMGQVLELRCFGGYDVEEIAVMLELPDYTVRRDLRKARALLAADTAP
ncbi:MAG: sigma-70 family RNA polymerase sigma factor [Proteobacteria bacterium]|nr:sigma-70 family RNA polymerase sigma factor [Pseudomonadota bacterium]